MARFYKKSSNAFFYLNTIHLTGAFVGKANSLEVTRPKLERVSFTEILNFILLYLSAKWSLSPPIKLPVVF